MLLYPTIIQKANFYFGEGFFVLTTRLDLKLALKLVIIQLISSSVFFVLYFLANVISDVWLELKDSTSVKRRNQIQFYGASLQQQQFALLNFYDFVPFLRQCIYSLESPFYVFQTIKVKIWNDVESSAIMPNTCMQ